MTGTDLNRPYREAEAWLEGHADRDARLLVDNTVWTDLVHRGFARKRTVWFYKLDLDPEFRIPWWELDYVVATNLMVGNLDDLALSREVYDRSRPVVRYSSGSEIVEIRKVVRPGESAAPSATAAGLRE